jgi:hypothetical protein
MSFVACEDLPNGITNLIIPWPHTLLYSGRITWPSKFLIISLGDLTLSHITHINIYKYHMPIKMLSPLLVRSSRGSGDRWGQGTCCTSPRGFDFTTDDQGCVACTFTSPIPGMVSTHSDQQGRGRNRNNKKQHRCFHDVFMLDCQCAYAKIEGCM